MNGCEYVGVCLHVHVRTRVCVTHVHLCVHVFVCSFMCGCMCECVFMGVNSEGVCVCACACVKTGYTSVLTNKPSSESALGFLLTDPMSRLYSLSHQGSLSSTTLVKVELKNQMLPQLLYSTAETHNLRMIPVSPYTVQLLRAIFSHLGHISQGNYCTKGSGSVHKSTPQLDVFVSLFYVLGLLLKVILFYNSIKIFHICMTPQSNLPNYVYL